MVDDGFYFYYDEWVLIFLMVDKCGLLMVDEWWLGFYGWWMVAGFLWLMNGGGDGGGGGCGWLWLMVEVVVVSAVNVFWVMGYIILLYWKLK